MSRFCLAFWAACLLVLCQILLVESSPARIELLGEPFKVNEENGGERPEVLAVPDGGFVILWRDAAVEPDIRTRGRRFDSAGQPVGAGFLVQAGGRPPAAVRGDSLVMVSEPAPFDERIGVYSLDGALEEALPVPAIDTLTVISNGDVVTAWSDQWLVYGSLISFDNPLAETRFVVDDHTTEYQLGVATAPAPDGSFKILWWAEFEHKFWTRSFEANATPLGDRVPAVEPPELGQPGPPDLCIDRDSGNLVVLWDTDDEARFRRLRADGTIASRIGCTGLNLATVSCLSDDWFVTVGVADQVFSSEMTLAIRAFDAQNRMIGTTTLPPSLAVGDLVPASAQLSDGTLVAVWQHCATTSAGCDILMQRFSVSRDPDCPGDCDGDGRVTIDELVIAVDVARTGKTALVRCPALESNVLPDLDCGVPLSTAIKAVNRALVGCD